MNLSRLSLPCWVRMLLALAFACWIGVGPVRAGAEAIDPDAAAVLEKAARPVDRAFVVSVVGEPEGRPLTGRALEEKTHEVALLLRCPVCQGSAVADSPSSTAVNMKNEVRDLVALGFSKNQILRYFEASYGQFVLMEPKAEGINWLVWIGPAVLLLAGVGVVIYTVRRLQGDERPSLDRVPARDELPDDPELAGYVRKVRELAFGWPGGEPIADPGKKGES